MTNPEQPAGSAQPARAAGYALLGLAAIALVIGVISLFGGSDDESTAAQPPPSSATSDPQAPSSGDPTGGSPTESSAGTPTGSATGSATPAPTTGADPTGAPATTGTPAGQGQPQGQATDTPPPPVVAKPPVRVYNNGTISGLAARASDDVRRAGWEVAETANYSQSQGLIPTTTVYYRPDTDEEASARQLAQVLNAEVKPRFDGIEAAHPGIIIILTNDYRGSSGKVS
ncbi:LytR C-terminal domain-containing protein [Saccharothrix sp. BKS2]|uniref:LytR C-terminal domain-containing protein n=1 Tax=Saccharothrix sp. BKS2 TaxID=3064400 RepID=UPI0039E85E33